MPKLTISLGLFDEMLGFCMLLYICEEKARSYQICTKDLVTIAGYSLGEDTFSVTKGVVSCIEVTSYAHGSSDLLGIQIDASINLEKENLCVYGLLNKTWKVNLSIEEVPPELSELALDINHVRDGMQKKD
ncbi:uncharacterized protein LOC125422266 isoform X2 [Ziziphus jujuba]|uniref:Uncharacterized protein LOC125422266 isoform X2 n=1 Tax=Ziziphus jujuba TaxID=326968 RepID=A0ABM4A074_ZIZJJ|nr:uncharacterized protein LOC125422266 isoform X2 [Ziziphus jujuba]